MQTKVVQALITEMTTNSPLTGAPEIHNLSPASFFQRSGLNNVKPETRIILATTGSSDVKTLGDAVKTAERTEPGTLAFAVLEDKEILRTVEVYENAGAVKNRGVKDTVELKAVKGFMGKG